MGIAGGGWSALLLPLFLLLLLAWGWSWSRRRALRLPYPRAESLPDDGGWRRDLWWYWLPAWRSVALVLVVFAMVRPQRVLTHVEREREGVAIVLAVDISSSMLAEDFQPENRIAVAKREVTRFVDARNSDRIGLVAFSGEALTIVPGTLDHALVKSAIAGLSVGQLTDGTALGVALATAANRVMELESESRVVVLLTDGDNNAGSISPEDAAAAAAALDIRVYTIGVGKEGLAPMPVARTATGFRYENVLVDVNDELLEAIAEATGGQYFRATDPDALSDIYTQIDELETTPLREVRIEERVELSRGFLLAAVASLLIEALGGATRARRVLVA